MGSDLSPSSTTSARNEAQRMNRPEEIPSMLAGPLRRLLTTAEAAAYLRFRSTSGIRTAVYRGELRPVGAGPKCCHLFTIAELDRFVSNRAARYARRNLETPGDRKAPPREEQRDCNA